MCPFVDYALVSLCFFLPPLSTFLIEGVLGSKYLSSKSWWERPKTWIPFQTPSTILRPNSSHFGFCRRCHIAGGAALQVMRHCRRWESGPALLGWYQNTNFTVNEYYFFFKFDSLVNIWRVYFKTMVMVRKQRQFSNNYGIKSWITSNVSDPSLAMCW